MKGTTLEFSKDMEEILKKLKNDFLHPGTYNCREMNYRDERAEYFIRKLFEVFLKNPLTLPDETLSKTKIAEIRKKDKQEKINRKLLKLQESDEYWRTICDHISGMTDTYIQKEYARFYEPFVAYMD